MRRLTPLLVLAVVLTFAAPAAAKEVTSVQVCGTDRCVTSDDEPVLAALTNGGTPSRPPGKPGGVVLLRASVSDGTSDEEVAAWMSAWLPRWRMVVFEDGSWVRVSAKAEAAFAKLATGLDPFPPSQLDRLPLSEIDTPTAAPPPDLKPAPAPKPAPAAASDTSGLWWLLIPGAIAFAVGGVALVRRLRPEGGAPHTAT